MKIKETVKLLKEKIQETQDVCGEVSPFDKISLSLQALIPLFFAALPLTANNFIMTTNNKLNNIWLIIVILLTIVDVILILRTYFKKDFNKIIISELFENINDIIQYKASFYANIIFNTDNTSNSILSPKLIIENICHSLIKTIKRLYNFSNRRASVGLCLIAQLDKEEDWEIIYEINNNANLYSLINNPASTVHNLISDEKLGYIFHASKTSAYLEGKYMFDRKDIKISRKRLDNIGSIYCVDVTMSSVQDCRFILCVHSYNKQFCDENDENAMVLFTEIIVSPFIELLKIELELISAQHKQLI